MRKAHDRPPSGDDGNPKGYHASAPYPLKYFSYRKKKTITQ